MSRLVAARLLATVLVLLGASAVIFAMQAFVPGDPVDLMVGQGTSVTASQREEIRQSLGLNDPLAIRYVRFLGGAVRGDLGVSVSTRRAVSQEILAQMPRTLELAAAAATLGVLVGVGLGVLAALRHGTPWDTAIMLVAIGGISIPVFWSGLFLLLVFSLTLRWLPASGGEGLERLIMPAAALGYGLAASVARLVRSSMLEVLHQEFMTTARSKGVAERVVVLRHALRNALIPVVTLIGLQAGWLLTGAVVVETVFSRPGLGRLLVQAINDRDFPLVQGIVLAIAAVYALINLGIDIGYGYLDPRVRAGASGASA